MNELPIRTRRLRVRRLQSGDLESFWSYHSDPSVGRYQGWNPTSSEECRQFIAEQQTTSLEEPGRWLQIAIALRGDDSIIGDIGLCPICQDEIEIGFSLAPDYQGRGYATEAVAGVIQALFASGRFRTVRAAADVRNLKSIALLERVGFTLLGTSGEALRGEWCELQNLVLLAERMREAIGDPAADNRPRRVNRRRRGDLRNED